MNVKLIMLECQNYFDTSIDLYSQPKWVQCHFSHFLFMWGWRVFHVNVRIDHLSGQDPSDSIALLM